MSSGVMKSRFSMAALARAILRNAKDPRGLDPTAARGLIDAQMPAAAKRSRSDYVIDNSGDITALEHSAAEVWRALLRRA